MSRTDWQRKLPPFNQHLGVVIKEWDDRHVVIEAELKAEFVNNSGIPHGGFIAALLDMATGHAGIYCDAPDRIRKALTLSLNINYQGQAEDNRIRVTALKTGGGRNIYFSEARAEDGSGNLLATAQAVCRYKKGSQDPEGELFEPSGV